MSEIVSFRLFEFCLNTTIQLCLLFCQKVVLYLYICCLLHVRSPVSTSCPLFVRIMSGRVCKSSTWIVRRLPDAVQYLSIWCLLRVRSPVSTSCPLFVRIMSGRVCKSSTWTVRRLQDAVQYLSVECRKSSTFLRNIGFVRSLLDLCMNCPLLSEICLATCFIWMIKKNCFAMD